MITHIVLGMGAIVAWCFYNLAGKFAGVSVTAAWSASTAYFLMAPVYSFRISSPRDIALLGLYSSIGFCLARISPSEKKFAHPKPLGFEPPQHPSVDLNQVIEEALVVSALGERLKRTQIEIEISSDLKKLPCSYADAVSAVSDVCASVSNEPELKKLIFRSSQRPGVYLLFVEAHRVWPPPPEHTITIGKGNTAFFDNGYGRIYQISLC